MKIKQLISATFLSVFLCTTIFAQDTEWQSLLDSNLSQWDVFIGVPHHTVKNLEGIPKGDGMKGTPLGLNNDPLNVFSTVTKNDELLLHVSGEIYGGLTSKAVYENYHLKFDFKWGELKWEPRLKGKRDNGLLYHCIGEHGAFWNVWMQSQEFQIQEGDMGDYFGLAGGVNNIQSTKQEDEFYIYNPNGDVVKLGSVDGKKMYRCVRELDYEKPHGAWNSLELICFNGKSYHIVNGHVVMILDRAETKTESSFEPVVKGKIQLQSEAAEAFYRNIQIRNIKELPAFLVK